MKILAVGSKEKGIPFQFELICAGHDAQRAPSVEEARKRLTSGDEFDLIVLHDEEGIVEANETAGTLKILADNLPPVFVVDGDVQEDFASARFGFPHIDRIFSGLKKEPILREYVSLQG